MDERDSGELCAICGKRYLTVWKAPDVLWTALMRPHAGLVCPVCFDQLARSNGVSLYWTCTPGEFPS